MVRKYRPREICAAGVVALALAVASPVNAQESIEQLCADHGERIERLFESLELDRSGLESVRAAVDSGDLPAACRALLSYYRQADTVEWLRREPVEPTGGTTELGEQMLNDEFTFYHDTRNVRRKDGRWDWRPTDLLQWNASLHRHPQLAMLLRAYRETGNPAYVSYLSEHVADWVLSNPYDGKRGGKPTMAWYGLEPGLRMPRWATVFYGLQQTDAFTDTARLLMLSSIPDHGHFNMHHHVRPDVGNWVTMQMQGLATAGLCWPEFKQADTWYRHAVDVMSRAIGEQVYPDGAQMELTYHYHAVAMHRFQAVADLARRAGEPVSREYRARLESMYNYLALVMRPDGKGLLNNDSDLIDQRRHVLKQAAALNRPDWRYVASNGKEGTKPDGLPSAVLPWAGQLVSRSDWDADAHWSFFDLGPWGTGHQHNDKLHVSVAAFGRDLLVDAGRYSYDAADRQQFLATGAHNTLTIDGRGQNPGRKQWRKPMRDNYAVLPELDLAVASFDRGYEGIADERIVHTRAVLYLRGRYWVVVDRVESEKPHDVEARWHFAPDCTVKLDGAEAFTADPGKGNLRIVPAGSPSWQAELAESWYSPDYNVRHENVRVIHRAQLSEPATFAWVLVPADGAAGEIDVETLDSPAGAVRLRIAVGGEPADEVAVRMHGDAPVPLSAGRVLDGRAAVISDGAQPRAVLGNILNAEGRTIDEHTFEPVIVSGE